MSIKNAVFEALSQIKQLTALATPALETYFARRDELLALDDPKNISALDEPKIDSLLQKLQAL